MPTFHTYMTYNVRGCVGIDGQRSEKRIAEVIASFGADIVGLQELDLGRKRSKQTDQAGMIAKELGFSWIFYPAMQTNNEHYGDAILSRWPLQVRKLGLLPSPKAFPFREDRGALWVEIATPQGKVQVMNTHFGVGSFERAAQTEALLSADWIGQVQQDQPLVVLGDFNTLPNSKIYKKLTAHLQDASQFAGKKNSPTFPTFLPFLTLDYIFANKACSVGEVTTGFSRLARRASDHFPLVGKIALNCHTNVSDSSDDISL